MSGKNANVFWENVTETAKRLVAGAAARRLMLAVRRTAGAAAGGTAKRRAEDEAKERDRKVAKVRAPHPIIRHVWNFVQCVWCSPNASAADRAPGELRGHQTRPVRLRRPTRAGLLRARRRGHRAGRRDPVAAQRRGRRGAGAALVHCDVHRTRHSTRHWDICRRSLAGGHEFTSSLGRCGALGRTLDARHAP
jgi:hypothetical protein